MWVVIPSPAPLDRAGVQACSFLSKGQGSPWWASGVAFSGRSSAGAHPQRPCDHALVGNGHERGISEKAQPIQEGSADRLDDEVLGVEGLKPR
jgi:hypothetical protein